MLVNYCVKGFPVVLHQQEICDVSQFLLMKQEGTSLKFFNDFNDVYIEGLIVDTKLETVLTERSNLAEQIFTVYISVKEKDLLNEYLKSILTLE